MKLIELFDNTILLETGQMYGWWISPNHKTYPINSSEGHKNFIINNHQFFSTPIGDKLEFYELYDRGFYNNWVRLSSYTHGKRRNLSVEGKQSALTRVSEQILDIAESFNRAEVVVLSETPTKTLGNTLKYEGIDFQIFELPVEMRDLEKYLKGKI